MFMVPMDMYQNLIEYERKRIATRVPIVAPRVRRVIREFQTETLHYPVCRLPGICLRCGGTTRSAAMGSPPLCRSPFQRPQFTACRGKSVVLDRKLVCRRTSV